MALDIDRSSNAIFVISISWSHHRNFMFARDVVVKVEGK